MVAVALVANGIEVVMMIMMAAQELHQSCC